VVNCLEYARTFFLSVKNQHYNSNIYEIVSSAFLFFYRSGASATGCRHQVKLGERYLDLHQNPVLGEFTSLHLN
jgi:hypothetical protein